VTIVANNYEQLPVFKKVGEIIRIHRCNISQFKNAKTFFVNMAYGSSWILFEGMPQKKKRVVAATTVQGNENAS
jgi:hypothetical protein